MRVIGVGEKRLAGTVHISNADFVKLGETIFYSYISLIYDPMRLLLPLAETYIFFSFRCIVSNIV